MRDATTASAFYQCPVLVEHSDAVLIVRGRHIEVNVVEQSIDGFAVTMPAKAARYISHGRRWHMVYEGIDHVVHPEWMFHPVDGVIQIGLRRLEESQIGGQTTGSGFGGIRAVWESFGRSCAGGSEMFFGAAFFVLVFLLVLSPIGDALGLTALASQFTSALKSIVR